MSARMTPRERLLAAFACQEVDRPPVWPNFIRWIRGNRGSASEIQQLFVMEEFGFDPLIVYGMYLNQPIASDYVYRPDSAGGYRDLPGVSTDVRVERQKDCTIYSRKFQTPDGVLTDRISWPLPNLGYGDGPNPHREEPLVKSLDDIPALRHLYAPPRPGFTNELRYFTEMLGDRGVVEYNEASNAGSWGMESLGPENMLFCAIENKKLLHAVLGVCQEVHLHNLKTVLESGHKHMAVSWFQCGPSVGWSPANIEEFFLPLIRQSVELAHKYEATYRYQDDGKMADIIPHLVQWKTDIIGGLQPPPLGDCVLADIKKRFDRQACLLGGLDPVYTFELGSPDRVRQAVKEFLDPLDDNCGIIVGTGEAFGPETPAECLRELTRSVIEFGQR